MPAAATQPNDAAPGPAAPPGDPFLRRVWTISGVLVLTVALVALVYTVADVLLLAFGGVLLALLLRGLGDLASRHTPLGPKLATGLVALLCALVLGGTVWMLGNNISQQAQELGQTASRQWQQLERDLAGHPWGQQLLQQDPIVARLFAGDANWLGQATAMLSTTVGILAGALILLFVGLYVAVDPGPYRAGILHLLPRPRRRRAEQVLGTLRRALQWWLVGKALSMVVVGAMTTLGLWLLGIPLALTLGLIALLLSFIPNFGPLLSFVPAALVALTGGLPDLLHVALLYTGVQLLESYLVTPMIQKRTLSLPPALLIVAQVVMGVLFGFLGLLLATPLTVVVLIVVQQLYVVDALADDSITTDGAPRSA